MMPFDQPFITGTFTDAAEHNGPAKKTGKTPPFSLRLTPAEKQTLLQAAGSMPLGAYIRNKLLKDDAQPRRQSRSPVKDEKALAQLLGELGKARLANNLNQLARAANTGSLPVTLETEQALQEACREVGWMKDRLIAALGLGPG